MKLLADLVAILHGLLVIFAAGGVMAVLLGAWRGWRWTRAFGFRFPHLMLCLIVVLFELAGQPCPLTTAEQRLRQAAGAQTVYEGSFIAHYVTRTIHLNVPPKVLSGPMLLVVVLVVLLYRHAGPVATVGGSDAPFQPGADADAEADSARDRQATWRRWWFYAGWVLFLSILLPALNHWLMRHWPAWSDRDMTIGYLVLGLLLCLMNVRLAGLRLGPATAWLCWGGWLAVFWVVPPLLVICACASMASRPTGAISWEDWCLNSIAQELLFAGFLYAQLATYWGEGPGGWRGALGWPVVGTALAFCLWHWPNALVVEPGYMAFQLVYTFVGGIWCLQMRRWTGSLLPGIANHVMVRFLASVM